MNYWLDENDWDTPDVIDRKGNVVKHLSVGDDDMRSFVILNGKLYLSNYGQSHYGAILNGLLKIHNLKTEEQLERKFKEDLDGIFDEVRWNDDGEGRIWDEINLVQITGTNDLNSEQIYTMLASELGVSKETFYVLDYDTKACLNDCPRIVKYKKLKNGIESTFNEMFYCNENCNNKLFIDKNMNKKSIIISEKQLNEIVGWANSVQQDFAYNMNNEITTSDSIQADDGDFENANPVTTDDIAAQRVSHTNSFFRNRSNIALREDSAHGNKDLNNRNFGGKSYQNAVEIKYRKKKAEKDLNSTDPVKRKKAETTLNNMRKNNDIDAITSQLNGAQMSSKSMKKTKQQMGQQVMASAPKTSGNGQAHSKKDDNKLIINYF